MSLSLVVRVTQQAENSFLAQEWQRFQGVFAAEKGMLLNAVSLCYSVGLFACPNMHWLHDQSII